MAQQARYPAAGVMSIMPLQTLQAIPNTAVARIPETSFAVADFNSVMAAGPPFRDIPSALVAILTNPKPGSATEPNWVQFIQHFFSKDHGMGNLQDLYLLATRCIIPNQLVELRQNLLDIDINVPTLSGEDQQTILARAWPSNPPPTPIGQGPYVPAYHDRPTPTIPPALTRPIMRSYPTPDGTAFVNWLQTPIPPAHPPFDNGPVTPQTEMAIYLMDDEPWIRNQIRLHPNALANRTKRVLEIFWFLAGINHRMAVLRTRGWPRQGLLQL